MELDLGDPVYEGSVLSEDPSINVVTTPQNIFVPEQNVYNITPLILRPISGNDIQGGEIQLGEAPIGVDVSKPAELTTSLFMRIIKNVWEGRISLRNFMKSAIAMNLYVFRKFEVRLISNLTGGQPVYSLNYRDIDGSPEGRWNAIIDGKPINLQSELELPNHLAVWCYLVENQAKLEGHAILMNEISRFPTDVTMGSTKWIAEISDILMNIMPVYVPEPIMFGMAYDSIKNRQDNTSRAIQTTSVKLQHDVTKILDHDVKSVYVLGEFLITEAARLEIFEIRQGEMASLWALHNMDQRRQILYQFGGTAFSGTVSQEHSMYLLTEMWNSRYRAPAGNMLGRILKTFMLAVTYKHDLNLDQLPKSIVDGVRLYWFSTSAYTNLLDRLTVTRQRFDVETYNNSGYGKNMAQIDNIMHGPNLLSEVANLKTFLNAKYLVVQKTGNVPIQPYAGSQDLNVIRTWDHVPFGTGQSIEYISKRLIYKGPYIKRVDKNIAVTLAFMMDIENALYGYNSQNEFGKLEWLEEDEKSQFLQSYVR